MIKSKKDLVKMTVATGENWIGELREVFSLSEQEKPALPHSVWAEYAACLGNAVRSRAAFLVQE